MVKTSKRKPIPRRRGDPAKIPEISFIIKSLRENQGWTQVVAAEKIGISRAALARIEQGHLGVSAKLLEHLLSFYGMTLSATQLKPKNPPGKKKLQQSEDDFPEW